jgi:hypothetical protein
MLATGEIVVNQDGYVTGSVQIFQAKPMLPAQSQIQFALDGRLLALLHRLRLLLRRTAL